MQWVWRGAMLFVGGLFSLLFIATAASPDLGECSGIDICIEAPPPTDPAELASSARIIDCTSVDLTNGPFLPASARNEVVRRVRANGPARAPHSTWERWISGELRYSPGGELQSVSVQPWTRFNGIGDLPEPSPSFEMSADLDAFYPLKSRAPPAACNSPTIVTFYCPSDGSPCSLGASPA